jgi:hypothetical protein
MQANTVLLLSFLACALQVALREMPPRRQLKVVRHNLLDWNLHRRWIAINRLGQS